MVYHSVEKWLSPIWFLLMRAMRVKGGVLESPGLPHPSVGSSGTARNFLE